MRIKILLLLLGLAMGLSSCRSTPKKHAEQQIVPEDKEQALSVKLDAGLYKAYGQWHDAEAERILNAMLEHLSGADVGFDEARGTRVRLLATATPLIAPGLAKTIYVSRGLLSTIYYENELAFALGTQLAFVKDHVTARGLANLYGQDVGESLVILPTTPPALSRDYLGSEWFEPGGLFDFGSTAWLKAEQEGTELAHKAKYDPRGAVSLTQRWTTPPVSQRLQALGKILPEPEERLNSAREEVAKLSPLRDPIVKSHAFEELQARLQVKKAKTKKKK